MRRFITSLPGKVISNLIVLSLLLPSISLALAARAEAQVAVLPSWAVAEFKNLKSPGTTFGKIAAEAVSSELLKTGQYEVVSQETVARGATALGISLPAEGVNLMRLAQEIRASTIVTGEIANYAVTNTGSGKMARVTLRTVVYDVASGLAINGAIVTADSTTRPGDVSDETLINDALQQGASLAIRQIQSRTLPTGTILNTTPDQALVNKGTRSGFRVGQEVIVLRGTNQVATGRIMEVEPDSSTMRVERFTLGVQPGDKVRAIFDVPKLVVGPDGTARQTAAKRSAPSSTLITALLVIGLIALLFQRGGGADNSVVSNVTAEATLDEAFQPAVRVSWSPNGFVKGNEQRVQWQVWRSDVVDSPVLTVTGLQTNALDRTETRAVSWTQFIGQVLTDCGNTSYNNQNATGVLGVRAGRPYIYSVDLVYAINSIDLPGGSGGGGGGGGTNTGGTTAGTTGGTTAGTTTGGANTGTLISGDGAAEIESGDGAMVYEPVAMMQQTNGTTNGGGTGGTAQVCYFTSPRATARGQATPLLRPSLNEPSEGAPVGSPRQFSFQSSVQQVPIMVEYIIQFSDSIMFPAGRTVTVTTFTRSQGGVISTPTAIDTNAPSLPAYIRSASTVFWRVGARNPEDRPGPLPDPQTNMRYIFSQSRSFTRPGGPPPPPAN